MASPDLPASDGRAASSEMKSAAAPAINAGQAHPERCAAALERGVEKRSPRRAAGDRKHVAGAVGETLRIFELAQLIGYADQHVGIRADAEAAAVLDEGRCSKGAVAKIGFGDRAKSGDRTALRHRPRLGIGHVGGMDEAPAIVHLGMRKQPFDRPGARPGETVVDLLHLLGDMDVDRRVAGHLRDRAKFLGRHRAQAVRRHADNCLIQCANQFAAFLDQHGEAIQIVDETPLTIVGRGAAEGRMGVEDRQKREADAGRGGCRGDALSYLGYVGVGFSVAVVMQVMEFADTGESGFQHLDIKLGGDRLNLAGVIASAKRYITSRHDQKPSADGPRTSASPAMPRWKAWLWRLGMPGRRMA